MIYYILYIFAQFISRKIFLDNLGDEFIGLTGTIQSFLKFLNLAELGIGAAIGFSLYKPLFNKDKNKVNKIVTLFRHFYKKIGFIVLGAGIILSGFFPIMFNDITTSLFIVYFLFFTFLIGLLLNFFYNYQVFLLEADQKNYVITSYSQSLNLGKLVIQSVIIFYFKDPFLWISFELIYFILYSILIKKRIKKEYPWLDASGAIDKKTLNENRVLIKKIKQIAVHKLGSFVTNGTDQILIFAFINVQSVAFFGNYQLIFGKLLQLINTSFAGTAAGIGNLVAENQKETIKKVFWEMMALRFFIAGFFLIILPFLVEPFISLWLGEKYILNQYVLLLFLINMFIMQIRVPVDHFKDAYGLFQDVWAPIIQSLINLTVSIVLLNYYGLAGILLGTFTAFFLIIMIWRPYYLYKEGFKQSVWLYWKGFLKLISALIVSFLMSKFIINYCFSNDTIEDFYSLILFAIKICVITFFIFTPIIYMSHNGFRDISKRMISILFKRK